jgi:hypothetical protein
MPRQTEITIQRADWGGLETAGVKVSIGGEDADVILVAGDFIKVKAPPKGDGPWIVLVTTPDGKKLLRPLNLTYDPKAETFAVKQQPGPRAKAPASDDRIEKAAETIAAAIREVAAALNSGRPAPHKK